MAPRRDDGRATPPRRNSHARPRGGKNHFDADGGPASNERPERSARPAWGVRAVGAGSEPEPSGSASIRIPRVLAERRHAVLHYPA